MEKSVSLTLRATNEDTQRLASSGAPSLHDPHPNHPKNRAGFGEQLSTVADVWHQEDAWAIQIAKRMMKGAAIGAFIGVSAAMTFKNRGKFAWYKLLTYSDSQNFNMLRIFKNNAIPWATAGAAAGFFHFMFMDLTWWSEHRSPLWNLVSGYAIMGGIATALMWHPRRWNAGVAGGAILGGLIYTLYYANLTPNRDHIGWEQRLPGVTDEERQKQKYRDEIHNLSYYKSIKQGTHKHL